MFVYVTVKSNVIVTVCKLEQLSYLMAWEDKAINCTLMNSSVHCEHSETRPNHIAYCTTD